VQPPGAGHDDEAGRVGDAGAVHDREIVAAAGRDRRAGPQAGGLRRLDRHRPGHRHRLDQRRQQALAVGEAQELEQAGVALAPVAGQEGGGRLVGDLGRQAPG
jgi:hypothetical protein